MQDRKPYEYDMTYKEMTDFFLAAEQAGKHLTGYIVFTQDSFEKSYSTESRTYEVSSDNKAYKPNMGSRSIYGSSLDRTDLCVRLERYMAVEKGEPSGWRIERCYMMSDEVDRARSIIRGEC